jgi:hypothetical protein
VAREALIIDEDVATGGAFEPLPKGWYHVEIEDVEEVASKSAKNLGKPMYKYKLKVVGGDFDGRKLFPQACLWPEAIFTQRDIQAALGIELGESKNGKRTFLIADEDDLIGKELKVRVIVKPKFVKEGEEPDTKPDGSPAEDNEVKGYAPLTANSAASPAVKKAGGAKKAGQFDL